MYSESRENFTHALLDMEEFGWFDSVSAAPRRRLTCGPAVQRSPSLFSLIVLHLDNFIEFIHSVESIHYKELQFWYCLDEQPELFTRRTRTRSLL